MHLSCTVLLAHIELFFGHIWLMGEVNITVLLTEASWAINHVLGMSFKMLFEGN